MIIIKKIVDECKKNPNILIDCSDSEIEYIVKKTRKETIKETDNLREENKKLKEELKQYREPIGIRKHFINNQLATLKEKVEERIEHLKLLRNKKEPYDKIKNFNPNDEKIGTAIRELNKVLKIIEEKK